MDITYDLQPITQPQYERARERYLSHVSTEASGVVAVFQFGAVTQPEISDLDLLIVVRDDIAAASLQALHRARQLDAAVTYLLAHPPFVVPHSVLSDVGWVHSLYGLHQIQGTRCDVPERSPRDRGYLDLADYVDFTFSVRSVLRGLEAGVTGLRSLLLLLTTCTHSLRLASTLTGRPVDTEAAQRVRRVRERALLRDPDGVLGEAAPLARDCIHALRKADETLASHLHITGMIRRAPAAQCVSFPDGRFYLFHSPFLATRGPREGRRLPGRVWRWLGVDPTVERLPAFYLAQFAAYASGSGAYAAGHRRVFGRRAAGLILDPGFRRALERRVQVAERILESLEPGGLTPMIPLGLGFRAPRRILPSRKRMMLRHLAGTAGRWERA